MWRRRDWGFYTVRSIFPPTGGLCKIITQPDKGATSGWQMPWPLGKWKDFGLVVVCLLLDPTPTSLVSFRTLSLPQFPPFCIHPSFSQALCSAHLGSPETLSSCPNSWDSDFLWTEGWLWSWKPGFQLRFCYLNCFILHFSDWKMTQWLVFTILRMTMYVDVLSRLSRAVEGQGSLPEALLSLWLAKAASGPQIKKRCFRDSEII